MTGDDNYDDDDDDDGATDRAVHECEGMDSRTINLCCHQSRALIAGNETW